jgi:hypothetical protein
MDDHEKSDNREKYIFTLLFTIIATAIYLIYLYIIIKYIIKYYKSQKLSILWLQYLTTLCLYILFFIIFLYYLFSSKEENIIIFNDGKTPLIITTIFLIANVFNTVNNFIYNSITSCKIILSLNKMININIFNFQDLFFQFKDISTNFFSKKNNLIFCLIFSIIDIILIFAFEFEYNHYEDKDTSPLFKIKYFIIYILKLGNLLCLIALIIFTFLLNFFKKKLLNKCYYNSELFAMKIYNILYNKILFASDIILFKIVADLIINCPILIFLIFKSSNTLFWIFSEIIVYLYILIFGALIFKLDKINEIGKIPAVIKIWFFWKNIKFPFYEYYHKNCLIDNTYKYSNQQKQMLKDLKLIDDIDEIEKIREDFNNINIIDESLKISMAEQNIINMEKLSIGQSEPKIKNKKNLNFNTSSELYVLYKLLMLYFEKNEFVYSKVQNKINEDGTPFKQLFTEQNITKNKRKKARQTFGGNDAFSKKKDFITNIDRISRISKLNSNNIISSLKLSEKQIFFSLEEKELKEEFKIKFSNEKDTKFNIESLTSNSFFELFPFYQMSIQDIIKSLSPSDNKKIIEILLKQQNQKDKIINIESESEDNLFYTYNSLLMMEVYEPEDFISFKDLSNFVSFYGTYLLDIIKNINFTFIPLILGIFNVKIAGENKIVILYRNPLFFTNFNHYNHWINFFITEGPERLKASIFQNEVIDINEIEIKNSLKMNEADYEEIINNLKRDFDFFMKINIQVYPIIHLFIGDEKDENNIHINESSIIENVSIHQTNLSGILNEFDDNLINTNISNNNITNDNAYKTESNSLVDKEYYSMNGNDIHTIKIYFTHFFRLNCELNKQKDVDDTIILKSNHYCQYLEGQIQTYLTKTTLFGIEDNDNN